MDLRLNIKLCDFGLSNSKKQLPKENDKNNITKVSLLLDTLPNWLPSNNIYF